MLKSFKAMIVKQLRSFHMNGYDLIIIVADIKALRSDRTQSRLWIILHSTTTTSVAIVCRHGRWDTTSSTITDSRSRVRISRLRMSNHQKMLLAQTRRLHRHRKIRQSC
jgi:hypothetical protein